MKIIDNDTHYDIFADEGKLLRFVDDKETTFESISIPKRYYHEGCIEEIDKPEDC